MSIGSLEIDHAVPDKSCKLYSLIRRREADAIDDHRGQFCNSSAATDQEMHVRVNKPNCDMRRSAEAEIEALRGVCGKVLTETDQANIDISLAMASVMRGIAADASEGSSGMSLNIQTATDQAVFARHYELQLGIDDDDRADIRGKCIH